MNIICKVFNCDLWTTFSWQPYGEFWEHLGKCKRCNKKIEDV